MNPNIARQYLLDYLKEEFGRRHDVRIRFADPNEGDGVLVRTEAREYLFETAWVLGRKMSEVEKLARKIKEVLELGT